jgi:endonuclease/exonuclease/phosphatase family metal-dependent hydrolase
MRDARVKNFMWSLGFSGCYAVSSEGFSGGLALFWTSSSDVTVKAANKRCIDAHVKLEDGMTWRASFVYGEPRREDRPHFWEFLRRMRSSWNGPWVCCGDFNEVLSQDEHCGPRDRSDSQIDAFRDCMMDCGLADLGFTGPKFTWCNKQDPNSHVRCRLDRAIANSAFSNLFEACCVENIIATTSDHYPILISLDRGSQIRRQTPVQQGFRFEAMWLRASDYKSSLEQAWSAGRDGLSSLRSTWDNLKHVAGSLREWSKEAFGSIRRNIGKMERRLASIRAAPASPSSLAEER